MNRLHRNSPQRRSPSTTAGWHAVTSSSDERESFDAWNRFHERRMWEQVGAKLRAQGADAERLRVIDAALAEVAPVSALDALKANARLVGLLTGRRGYVIQQAREQGAEWAEIGEALGVSKQAAWAWYKRKIEDQETYAPDYPNTAGARAAL